MPKPFVIITNGGSFRPAGLIAWHSRCASAFVIGVVTVCPPDGTVFCTGLQCVCTAPGDATKPPVAKLFFISTLAGVFPKGLGASGVDVAVAV